MAKNRKPAESPKTAGETKQKRGKAQVAPPAKKVGAESSTVSVSGNEIQLSAGEVNILAVFRKYLMTPGRMLCLSNTDIGTMKRSLEKLTAAGLLTPEDFKGSYSLTRSGFQAMNELG